MQETHFRSTTAFGNSTLRSSITVANVTSSTRTRNKSLDPCWASQDVWFSSLALFQQSVSSAKAAGRYSTTTLFTVSETLDYLDWSYVEYTPKDESTAIKISVSSFPTAPPKIVVNTITNVLAPAFTEDSPNCVLEPLSLCDTTRCTISAVRVQLFYWPVSTGSGHSNLTVTSNATEPVRAVVNGTTFTSPTVYLRYDGVFATDACSHTVGKSYSGAVLSLLPDALSSINLPHDPTHTFNFADLNKPYSPDVMIQMCFPDPVDVCEVGIDDIYYPKLVVPDEIRALDPAWRHCDPDWFGSWDPPRILVPASVLVNPTPAADVRTTSSIATPAPFVMSQGAPSTSKLDAGIPSTSGIPSVLLPPNQNPSIVDPSDPKPLLKSTSAINSAINHAPSIIRPDPNQNPPTTAGPPAQNTPATNPPANHPSIIDPSPKDPTATVTSANDLSINDPPAKTPTANSSPIKTPLANEVPSRPSSVDNSHRKDPAVLLPHFTVDSQTFTADPATDYVVGSKVLTPTGEIATSLPILIVGSHSFTANHENHYIISSQTLTPGGQITVAGALISAPTISPEIRISTPILPSLLIASETYSADSASQYMIASQTLTPNGRIVGSRTLVSLLPSASAVVSGSFTETFLPVLASPTAPTSITIALVIGSTTAALIPSLILPPLTIASKIYTADVSSQYIIASQTLTPNGQITFAGTTVSLLPSASALIIDGTTNTLKPTLVLPSLTIGPEIFTPDSTSRYIINHQTLSLGGYITVSEASISLASEAPALMSKSNEEPFFSHFALPSITIGSKIYTANQASAYIIDHQTLNPDAQITVDRTPISLAPQASALVVGSSTELFSHFALQTLTINSKEYTANPVSAYIINGQTLTPGGQISVDGKFISLALQASALMIGSSTETLLTPFALPSIIVDSEVYTANEASAYIIKGQTLTAAGRITVQGTPVSLALDGSGLVVGSNTQNLRATSSTIGLGQLIMDGLNGGSGRDGGKEGTISSAPQAGDGSDGRSRVNGTAETSVTSMMSLTSTPASIPTQTTVVFAGGARTRWNRSWIKFTAILSAIVITLH